MSIKRAIAILMLAAIAASGCSCPEAAEPYITEPNKTESRAINATIEPNETETIITEPRNVNDYFFPYDARLTADITTGDIVAFESRINENLYNTERTNIIVYKIADTFNGSIHRLIIDPVVNLDGYLDVARLNKYFYVTENEIYRIWSYIYENGVMTTFYDDDNLMLECLNTEEKIFENSYLVFRREETPDAKQPGEEGMHNIIEVNENQIMSRMWSVTPNGYAYFYERFLWELDKGLIYYLSGFRAERDQIVLDNFGGYHSGQPAPFTH